MKAIVITARGFHAGYLGCYGNVWINTPGLDRLAAQGVVFDQHFADVPDARAAARAWRSGQSQLHELPPAADLLAALHAAKITTFLIRDGANSADPTWQTGWHKVRADATGLDPCLDALGDCLDEAEALPNWLIWLDVATLLPPWQIPDEQLRPYFDDAEEEDEEGDEDDEDEEEEPLEEDEDENEEPLEPLEPWLDPPAGAIDPHDDDSYLRLAHTYAAAVSYFDTAIELLLAELKVRHLLDDCLLLVTTDCGQALGEHGVVGPYRPPLHEEVSHIPLVARWPGKGALNSLRVAALTHTVDLMPTLLDFFGVALPPGLHGHSLLPLVRGERDKVRDVVIASSPGETLLRTADWALLDPAPDTAGRAAQLFAKPMDRWEVNDLQQHHLEWVEALQAYLRAAVAALHQPGPLVLPPVPEARTEEPAQ